ncbi:myb family transcription factor [Genlisea aurea]|uniref:Myb family transcription factor n=1 Tax=Genlisea aurea TaxID=192259 RepID=S8DEZ4_9LAMI|nr:myb family transcription factor [Genlisea aurea]
MEEATAWTVEENKKFEDLLAVYDEKTPNRWFKVAKSIPGKSVSDVMNQYRVLESDVCNIEAGLIPIPVYLASSSSSSSAAAAAASFTLKLAGGLEVYRKRSRDCAAHEQERKKGVPWTEDEHRRFLLGLQKHGKGDWRSISRNYVISKTPTQVASHAQKYYQRQLSGRKDRRRPSIHDITIVNPSSSSAPPVSGAEIPSSMKNAVGEMGGGGFIVLNSDNAFANDDHFGFSISAAGYGFMGFQ